MSDSICLQWSSRNKHTNFCFSKPHVWSHWENTPVTSGHTTLSPQATVPSSHHTKYFLYTKRMRQHTCQLESKFPLKSSSFSSDAIKKKLSNHQSNINILFIKINIACDNQNSKTWNLSRHKHNRYRNKDKIVWFGEKTKSHFATTNQLIYLQSKAIYALSCLQTKPNQGISSNNCLLIYTIS
jgi:hypothetical protein